MESTRRPIHVLHITFNMGFGGTEQVIRQLVRQMPKAEFVNSILCIDGSVGPLGQSLQKEGVKVHSVSRSPGFDFQLIRKIRDHIQEGKFDVVHCHQYTPFVYGRIAALGTAARVVLTEHGRFHPDRFRFKAAAVNWLLAMITPAVVAISSATRDALARFEFFPSRRIKVIYNGIEGLVHDVETSNEVRTELGIPEGSFLWGTVSRLDSVKNQSMMIRAFLRFVERYPDSYLLIVGDGPERKSLGDQAAMSGVADRIIFTGYIEHPARYMGAMNGFLLSSFTEGTSMTLLEAMSLGVPSVVTRVGGNPEIVIDGETGLLAENDDEIGFADAMATIYSDHELRERLSKNSQDRFQERFTVSRMTEQYETLYLNILDS
ncbi:glycosyltransferase [Marinobacter salsuginis]|uniref:glycosyltransferase n=1 Tax=Marinobacter salsuginis TaxID=418719 RepID=UPI00273DEE07|nr:glycosyltransferase [Marinobacter salsuginis]